MKIFRSLSKWAKLHICIYYRQPSQWRNYHDVMKSCDGRFGLGGWCFAFLGLMWRARSDRGGKKRDGVFEWFSDIFYAWCADCDIKSNANRYLPTLWIILILRLISYLGCDSWKHDIFIGVSCAIYVESEPRTTSIRHSKCFYLGPPALPIQHYHWVGT